MPDSLPASLIKVLSLLLTVAAVALIVTILAHGQVVLVPLALAILLTFVLTPLVKALERWGLHRIGSVAVVVILLLAAVAGFGYVLSRQFNDLATQMTKDKFADSIQDKIARLRGGGRGTIEKIQRTVTKVNRELVEQAAAGRPEVPEVRVVPAQPTLVERFRGVIEPVIEPLAMAGIVLVLLIFMLIQREDIRNRFIRLVGQGKVTLTTKTMDEAGHRISRFLLAQSIINGSFGAVVAIGLVWIGVPYAVLWGFVAAILRFIPYVGSMLAMLLPTLLAFVLFETWRPTLETLALFLGMDAITANVVEPLLIGHNTGVSSLALLISAMFWTWLWGPIGLVLSTPITVCLAVLGKHVPQLEFLSVLLGDEPALETEISFYQRLLAGDEDEAGEIIEQQLQSNPPEQVFDEVIVPALILAERDRVRDAITEADQQFVLRGTRVILQTIASGPGRDDRAAAGPPGAPAVAGKPQGHILGVPARNLGDELCLEMLSQLFDPITCEVERLSAATLASEVILAIERRAPDLVCVMAIPPGGLAHVRYLCKRIRARFPEVRILAVRPAARSDTEKTTRRLIEGGADKVAFNLAEARSLAAQLLLPALVRPVDTATAARPLQPVAGERAVGSR